MPASELDVIKFDLKWFERQPELRTFRMRAPYPVELATVPEEDKWHGKPYTAVVWRMGDLDDPEYVATVTLLIPGHERITPDDECWIDDYIVSAILKKVLGLRGDDEVLEFMIDYAGRARKTPGRGFSFSPKVVRNAYRGAR